MEREPRPAAGPLADPSADITRVATVDTREIVRRPELQVRRKLDRSTVHTYANQFRAGVVMPNIRVADVGGALVLVDGWHRLAAMDEIGRTAATVDVVTCADLSEAAWLGADANLRHGLPLKPSEIRPVFRAYVRAKRHVKQKGRHGFHRCLQSYREIAQTLGGRVSFHTIRNWMRRDFPRIAAAMSDDDGGVGRGGSPDTNPEDTFARHALDALGEAAAASKGVRDPARRGHLLARAQETLDGIRNGGPWKALEEPDF